MRPNIDEEDCMLISLMNEEWYSRFVKLRPGIQGAAHVFVPVGSSPGPAGPELPRILFVGRATRGWDEDWVASYKGALETGTKVLLAGMSGRRDTGERWYSPYWNFNRAVARRVAERLKPGSSEVGLVDYVGWSNLAKIGDSKGNPGPISLAVQADLCSQVLRAEIDAFKPTAVVLATGDYAMNGIVSPTFGDDNWSWMTSKNDLLSWKFDTTTHALIVWTNHPQRMGEPGNYAHAFDFTVDLILSAAGSGSMPPSAEPRPDA